jgi:hypothetical protein
MIKVFLRGGLGNQMFQYALGIALAKRYNTDLVFDTTFLNDRTPRNGFTFRSYALGMFNVAPKFTFLSRISFRFPIPVLWLGLSQLIAHTLSFIGIRPYIRRHGDRLDFSVLKRGGNICIDGYFQSEQYFENAIDEVARAFTFKEPIPPELKTITDWMGIERGVCVHVRRGDYVSNPIVAQGLGVLGPDYYARAFEEMKRRINISRVYIFSDDIPWCKENLSFGNTPVTYEDAFLDRKGFDGFRLMTHCQNFIIGNSTYAWWAAWLANAGVVIAPSVWAKDGSVVSDEIIPRRWIRI